MTRPFRFTATMPDPSDRVVFQGRLDTLAALGFDTISAVDHFASGLGFVAEPLTTLAFAAAWNPSLTIQTGVLCNDYRHPVLAFRMAASLSQLSEGRLELGLGAGWLAAEYAAAGLRLDPPAVRVARLTEAVTVLKGLFAESPFSFSGEHYQISDLAVFPAGKLPPRPRFMIGGAGPVMLALAGREADIIGISATAHMGAAAIQDLDGDHIRRRVDWALAAAGDAGRDARDLELTSSVMVVRVTRTEAEAVAFAEQMGVRYGMDPVELRTSPVVLIGVPEACAQKLLDLRQTYGLSYFHIDASNLGSTRVDQMHEVISLVRADAR